MADIVKLSNISEEYLENLQLSLVFDVFQFLVILISLSAGLILLVVLPTVKARNLCTIWTLVLFGFLHEFYSVVILAVLKFNVTPPVICMDSHVTSMLVTTFILCTILTSALKTTTKSSVISICIWIYILCSTTFLTHKKVDGKFVDLNVEVKPKFHFHLTSCGANMYKSPFILFEYLIIYLPLVLIFIVLRKQQSKNDLQFWNISIIPSCSPDGRCTRCSQQNHVLQIMLLYLSITVYILRPVFIIYHLLEGGMYYDVLTSIVVMGTYCFLCLETYTGLRKCKVDTSKYSKSFMI